MEEECVGIKKNRRSKICVFSCQFVQVSETEIKNHLMKHVIQTCSLSNKKNPQSLRRGNIPDVDSVTEMLVAALLSGVQWSLIMS